MSATVTPAALGILMSGTVPHAVLDLRERAAYERGHIFWATSLPRRLLETRLPPWSPPPPRRSLIDEDGGLSELARPTLAAMGYTDVHVLTRGLPGGRGTGPPCRASTCRARCSASARCTSSGPPRCPARSSPAAGSATTW